jgi:cytochrome d ubiquinol oxidase subunit I
LEIPGALSFLAFRDFDALVKGLEEFPKENHPPVAVVHIAFQIMVACGVAMLGVVVWAGLLMVRARRRSKEWRLPENKALLRAIVAAAPLGFLAIEAGWTVTEVGRQPFIIQGVLRTADAVTPVPNLTIPLITFSLVYLFLAFVVVYLLLRQFRMSPRIAAGDTSTKRPAGTEAARAG